MSAGKHRPIWDRNSWFESRRRRLAQGRQSSGDRAGHTIQEESGKRWRLHQCAYEPFWGTNCCFAFTDMHTYIHTYSKVLVPTHS